jgi:phage terminase small subunit
MDKVEPKSAKPLRPKEARFVEEYLVDGNGTRAARAAGYGHASAVVTASRLLRKGNVLAALESARTEQSKRTALSADAVLLELKRLALVDVTQAYDEHGNLKPLDQIPEDVRRSMQGIDIAKTGEKVARFHSKDGALTALAKHFGLLRDKVEVSGKDGQALSIHIDLGAGK